MTFCIWIINFLLVIGLGFVQIFPSNYTIAEEISSGLNPKMIGGQDAAIERARFVVAIFDRENFICGGALITYQAVLTAATCTYRVISFPCNDASYIYEAHEYNAADLVGTIGNVNRLEGHRILFREIRRHWCFEYNARGDDIAILILPEPITPNNGIVPIRMGIDKIQINSDEPVSLYGWKPIIDSQSVDDISSDILQVMPMVLLSSDLCNNQFFIRPDQLEESEICAKPAGYGILETGGDMGGPLVHYIGGMEPVLLGLMSRVNFRTCGTQCGNHVISIFTNVYRYPSWLHFNMIQGFQVITLRA